MLTQLNAQISQKLLNLIGSESKTKPWQQAYYVRHIQQVVKLNIETMDYKDESGMGLANKLMNFVDNWHTDTAEIKNLQLSAQIKSFKAASASLPGSVTATYQNPTIKAQAEKAYQKLILLEIVNYIENIQASLPEDKAQEKNKINDWIKTQQAKLQPGRYDFWYHTLLTAFNRIFGASLTWLTQGAPYIIKFYAQYLKRTAFSAPGYKNYGIGLFNAIFLPLNLYFGAIFRAIGLLLFPLRELKRIFPSKLLNYVHVGAAIWLLSKSFIFLPVLSTALQFSIMALAATAAVGALVFLAEVLLHQFGYNLKLTDDQTDSPLKETVAVCASTLFATSIPFAMNETFPHCKALFTKCEAVFKRNEALDKELNNYKVVIQEVGSNTNPKINASNLEARKELLSQYQTLSANADNLIQEGVIEFLDTHFNLQVPGLENMHYINLEEIQKTLELQPKEKQDFDKQKLIAQLLRLKVNKNTTTEHGEEVANLVKNMNPTTYVNQFKTVDDLPEVLRPFAKPAGSGKPRPSPQ